jgi:UPF0716 protein FxsA
VRRRVPWGLVAALFVVVPLLEIYLVIQAGQLIGVGWTILILVADSLLGAVLLKREGGAAWRALVEAISSYRVPARELADGAVVLVGGTLLLTPGFFTDALGFLFLLPFTRPLARRALTGVIARRFLGGATTGARPGREEDARTRRRPGPDDVVQGEVVD